MHRNPIQLYTDQFTPAIMRQHPNVSTCKRKVTVIPGPALYSPGKASQCKPQLLGISKPAVTLYKKGQDLRVELFSSLPISSETFIDVPSVSPIRRRSQTCENLPKIDVSSSDLSDLRRLPYSRPLTARKPLSGNRTSPGASAVTNKGTRRTVSRGSPVEWIPSIQNDDRSSDDEFTVKGKRMLPRLKMVICHNCKKATADYVRNMDHANNVTSLCGMCKSGKTTPMATPGINLSKRRTKRLLKKGKDVVLPSIEGRGSVMCCSRVDTTDISCSESSLENGRADCAVNEISHFDQILPDSSSGQLVGQKNKNKAQEHNSDRETMPQIEDQGRYGDSSLKNNYADPSPAILGDGQLDITTHNPNETDDIALLRREARSIYSACLQVAEENLDQLKDRQNSMYSTVTAGTTLPSSLFYENTNDSLNSDFSVNQISFGADWKRLQYTPTNLDCAGELMPHTQNCTLYEMKVYQYDDSLCELDLQSHLTTYNVTVAKEPSTMEKELQETMAAANRGVTSSQGPSWITLSENINFTVNARAPPGFIFYFDYNGALGHKRLENRLRRKIEQYWGMLFGFKMIAEYSGLPTTRARLEYEPSSGIQACLYLVSHQEMDTLDDFYHAPEKHVRVLLPVWLLTCPGEMGVAENNVPALLYVERKYWRETDGSGRLAYQYDTNIDDGRED